LKERYPDLRVLVLRVHDEPAVVSLILDAGASGYVLKRSAATDLLPAVEVALRGGTYVSPTLSKRAPARGDEVETT
jgi:DNA-binding NarL/FixJ family response regulator